MADITNPEAVLFCNQSLRPMANRVRDLFFLLEAEQAAFNLVADKFPNNGSIVQDGREAAGISRLTGTDVNNFQNRVNQLFAVLDAAYAMDVVHKATDRAFQIP